MPSQYVLKNSPLDKNRIQKVCKKLIDEANEDRSLALDTHRFFREMLDENPQDASAKNLMVDCLKLAQTVDLLIKLESAQERGADKTEMDSLYSQLDNLTD